MTSPTLHRADLDPSLIGDQLYSSRGRRYLVDVAFLLNLMILLLLLIPSAMVFPQLTAVGRPALMVGLLLTVGWTVSKLHPRLVMRGPQPLRWAAACFLGSFLLSYAAGWLRGLPILEGNSADRTLVATLIMLGTVLIVADGVPNRSRLDDVLKVLVGASVGMALIGMGQFVLGYDFLASFSIPGLEIHSPVPGLEGRGGAGFNRVNSTAAHYIELSAVLTMVLPFAIHFGRFARTRAARQWFIIGAGLMAATIPMTLSRTGVLALAIGLLAMFPFWSWRMRFNIGVSLIAVMAALMVVEPGLLGTLKSLFTAMGEDPSIQGRTDDYQLVAQYFAERPWFGRGEGTFLPSLYFFVDNQWLQQVLGGGIVGVAALVGLHVTAITLAAVAYRRTTQEENKHLCACLIAVQLIAMAVGATFDSLGFSTFTTVLALLTGVAGAIWRLTHPARQIRTTGARLHSD